MKFIRLLLLFSFSFTMAACQKSAPANLSLNAASKPDVQAPRDISQSFAAVVKGTKAVAKLLPENQANLKIFKASLEKEFLLQAGLIQHMTAALGNSLRSRIVSFRRFSNKVYLLEATQGHLVDKDIPHNFVLASFPILSESEDSLVIDFNQGMSEIFVADDWAASDFTGRHPDGKRLSVKTKHSFLTRLELVNNKLVIHQVANVDLPADAGFTNSASVEARYYLAPYAPTEGFVPTPSTGFRNMGFFEVAPFFGADGRPVVLASKWDIRKPIVFAISSNTPPEFRDAVREGILYFNKTLGPDRIQVVDAPAGVTAPQFEHNIFQWVKWDEGMGAYADAQMDPRTGEILKAQIYFGSVFAVEGKNLGRVILDRLERSQPKGLKVGLRGFDSLHQCNHFSEELARSFASFLATNPSEEAILRASQDFVREVAAHEVGHTLGLRHNFAGSLSSNVEPEAKFAAVEKYLRYNQAPEGVITTSSVMEYSNFEDAVITGYHVKHAPQAMAYDHVALQSLYFGKKFERSEMPLFCTDMEMYMYTGKFLDCMVWDSGKEPLLSHAYEARRNYAFFADSLYRYFDGLKERKRRGDLQSFPFTPEYFVGTQSSPRFYMSQSWKDSGRLLSVARTLPNESAVYDAEIQEGSVRALAEQVARGGGTEALFAMMNASDAAQIESRFQAMLETRGARDGFTAEELAEIRGIASRFFPRLREVLLKTDVMGLSGDATAALRDHALSDSFARYLASVAEEVIFSFREERLVAEIELPKEKPDSPTARANVSLPKPRYGLEMRVAAAKLLQSSRGKSPVWAMSEKSRLQERLKKVMEDGLTLPNEKFVHTRLPSPVARWLVENRKVLATLGE